MYSTALTSILNGIPVHRVPLRPNEPHSIYSFAVAPSYWYTAEEEYFHNNEPRGNFLATQVWPCSRVACFVLETFATSLSRTTQNLTFCEFGCGTGLPSLTIAKLGIAKHVIATDHDDMALKLVQVAAEEQHLTIETKKFDLTNESCVIPSADVYLFSDLFVYGGITNKIVECW